MNEGSVGVSPWNPSGVDTMSGLKTKKLGTCWPPKVGRDSFGRLAETSSRHRLLRKPWPPAKPSISMDKAKQKAG